MSKKGLFLSLIFGLALIVSFIVMRDHKTPKPASETPKPASEKPLPQLQNSTSSSAFGSQEPSDNASILSIIEAHIQREEERQHELQAQRDKLLTLQRELEAHKEAALIIGNDAASHLRVWEILLKLTPTQKQTLLALSKRWEEEDSRSPGTRQTWLVREAELRALLTSEQTAKLHEKASREAQRVWSATKQLLINVLEMPLEEQSRLQHAIGEAPQTPNSMLIAQAYGFTMAELLAEIRLRADAVLTPEQLQHITSIRVP